ncbi:MAG: alpha/beta fold hydrolase, partial [Nitrospinaceae bacterium]|nr:alpha/beta fold hydrolase [Nitrospinaceae bacterium]NIR54439.1 alpha/beta fold hydrolase [Nitrospinaceae bacterium]NIT81661.1 alpha/beta fold hydrolase [Nitrospinaceae bacterium]NIW05529.1 alpha/beta fold hydrolase [Nitrospinaceae bacterium]NIX34064.1 alpha/beta fold hydrolase [Nitrospinaceae bacterium]
MDYIVVLHGIARTWRSMRTLVKYFKERGYPVLNVGYPSTRLPLESLVQHIRNQVAAFNQDENRKIHFIGYSLGGLLARGLLHLY